MSISEENNEVRTNPIPDIPSQQKVPAESSRSSVKVATPDIILFNERPIPIDAMTDIFFEQIGGQELINISRNDIVNGQDVSYSIIGNLRGVQRRYNTENIFSLPDTINKIFKNFSIRFDIHVPEIGTGPNNSRAYVVSQDSNTVQRGDLVIDVTNMEVNERVDVEILRNGEPLSDTIYLEES